jgi:ribonuclease P protein component
MLPRKRRIPSLWFKGRYRRITSQKGPHVLVSVFRASEVSSPTRFACVVSKKGINAPTRNSIRRRVYAIIEELLPHVRNGLYCTLSLSKEVADMSHDALCDEMIDLFRKSGVI